LNSCAATMPSDIVFSEGGGEDPNEAPPQTDEVYGRLPKILVDSA
jgi:hypothetical protein